MDQESQTDQLLGAYLSGEMLPEESTLIGQRLENEPDLRAHVLQMREVLEVLKQGRRPVSEELSAQLRQRVNKLVAEQANKLALDALVTASLSQDLDQHEQLRVEKYLSHNPAAEQHFNSLRELNLLLKKAELPIRRDLSQKLVQRLAKHLPAAALKGIDKRSVRAVSSVRVFAAPEDVWQKRLRWAGLAAAVALIALGAAKLAGKLPATHNQITKQDIPPGIGVPDEKENPVPEIQPSNGIAVAPGPKDVVPGLVPPKDSVPSQNVPKPVQIVEVHKLNDPSRAVQPMPLQIEKVVDKGVVLPPAAGNDPFAPQPQQIKPPPLEDLPGHPFAYSNSNPQTRSIVPIPSVQNPNVSTPTPPAPTPPVVKPLAPITPVASVPTPVVTIDTPAPAPIVPKIPVAQSDPAVVSPAPSDPVAVVTPPKPAPIKDPANTPGGTIQAPPNMAVVGTIKDADTITQENGNIVLHVRQPVASGAIISTDHARAALVLPGNGRLYLNHNTILTLDIQNTQTNVNLTSGQVAFKGGSGAFSLTSFGVDVTNAHGSVDIQIQDNTLVVTVLDKTATVGPKGKVVQVTKGTKAVAFLNNSDSAPKKEPNTADITWHDDLILPGDTSADHGRIHSRVRN